MPDRPPGAEVLGRAAIAGLRITETGRAYGRTSGDFAADAAAPGGSRRGPDTGRCRRAPAEVLGMTKEEIDDLLERGVLEDALP